MIFNSGAPDIYTSPLYTEIEYGVYRQVMGEAAKTILCACRGPRLGCVMMGSKPLQGRAPLRAIVRHGISIYI